MFQKSLVPLVPFVRIIVIYQACDGLRAFLTHYYSVSHYIFGAFVPLFFGYWNIGRKKNAKREMDLALVLCFRCELCSPHECGKRSVRRSNCERYSIPADLASARCGYVRSHYFHRVLHRLVPASTGETASLTVAGLSDTSLPTTDLI